MIEMIVACGKNGEIGKQGKLMWTLKEDLKYFKKVTEGNTVVMGYDTYKSIGKPLPNRENIVVSRKHVKELEEKNIICIDKDPLMHILDMENENPNKKIIIIGGESIYNLFINVAERLHITIVNSDFPDADKHFPLEKIENKVHKELFKKEKDNENEYDFTTYIVDK